MSTVGTKDLRHYEEEQLIRASAEDVFGFLDIFQNLSKHMAEPTWKMLWGWMRVKTDEKGGQEVGSVVSLTGSVLGVKLALVEKVVRREPPYCKAWQTFNGINLLVIGHYTLGFEITPQDGNAKATVYIDYELPNSARTRWLGYLFGDMYAKWCVREMLHEVHAHFQTLAGTH
ncbi:MAG: SRPBCC family protein [Chloroflexi bacterium]|nr:SRPBCC family protein [Chloroflexota bacterium]